MDGGTEGERSQAAGLSWTDLGIPACFGVPGGPVGVCADPGRSSVATGPRRAAQTVPGPDITIVLGALPAKHGLLLCCTLDV